ncbi:hypothetical protein PIIN_11263, partial [Serendipita indica DSM 11827]
GAAEPVFFVMLPCQIGEGTGAGLGCGSGSGAERASQKSDRQGMFTHHDEAYLGQNPEINKIEGRKPEPKAKKKKKGQPDGTSLPCEVFIYQKSCRNNISRNQGDARLSPSRRRVANVSSTRWSLAGSVHPAEITTRDQEKSLFVKLYSKTLACFDCQSAVPSRSWSGSS